MRRTIFSFVFLWATLGPRTAVADRPQREEDPEAEEERAPPRARPPRREPVEVAGATDDADEAERAAERSLDPKKRLELGYLKAHAAEGRRTRLAGIIVTAIGAVLAAAGVGMVVFGTTYGCHNNISSSTCDALLAVGAGMGAVGVGLAGVGIPLWVTGSNKARKYDDKREKLLFGMQLEPRVVELALAVRF